uniref:hypothetical protein n=1 Tax=Segatella hominis TaxID=2518605 RepID=UPI004029D05D
NATKSQRLPQPLETQNKSSNLLFFAFLVILFPKKKVRKSAFSCHFKESIVNSEVTLDNLFQE